MTENHPLKDSLTVAPSELHGKGLFATLAIRKGTVIGYCDTRKTRRPGRYTLHLATGPVDVTCCFKYINHSPRPNVAYYDDLSVVALKAIKPGDELTHHYGDDWE